MKSPLLRKLSQRKTGWKPSAIILDDKTIRRNACMVGNGRRAKLVEINCDDDDLIDKELERTVIETIKQLEAKDFEFVQLNTIIFSALASTTVSQATTFIDVLHKDGKFELNRYIGQSEKLVKSIQSDAIKVGGEPMKDMLDNLEDVTYNIFQKMANCMIDGSLVDFANYVLAFEKTEK